jgi:hypothetical protein
MARQRKLRRLETACVMALVAAVLVRRGRELALVHVLMTAAALGCGDVKDCVLALGYVALLAFDGSVLSFERIRGGRMQPDRERRRLEAFDLVTGRAIGSCGSRQELSLVIIRMAVGAFAMRDRRLEIALGVAVAASHAAVLAFQRKDSLGMIEAFQLRDTRPTRRAVAGLAGPLEAALVRIGMAGRAAAER